MSDHPVLRRARGPLLALVLLGVYAGAWRPARACFTACVVYPLTARAASASQAEVIRLPDPLTVEVRVPGLSPQRYRTPVGIEFLLTGMLLLVLYPRRPYFCCYWLGVMVLAAVSLAAFVGGVTGARWFFGVNTFIGTYVSMAACLAVAAVATVARTTDSSAPGRHRRL